MNNPQIPALLVSHHRPGFYLRVLREGAVQAGDEIVQVAAGPEAMTVAEVDALLYLPGHSRQQVARALRIPALPAGWRDSFQAMLGQAEASGGPGGNAGLTAVSPHRDLRRRTLADPGYRGCRSRAAASAPGSAR
jgi:hypothetical protein